MSVPIEKLQLEKLLDERVFVKWIDQSGTTLTLGSCLYGNKQNPKFFMVAYLDIEGHVHIHFKLQVSIKLAGKKQQMDMLLVVPPDADFASASTPRPISSIDDLSHDASAIHEAGLSDSQHVFLIKFKLTAKGFVIAKKKTAPIIRPSTTTAEKLVHSLESLSNTSIFSVYIRPSTYAEVNLQNLRTHLVNACATIDTWKTITKEMYIQQGAMLVEWNRFLSEDQQHVLPPPYTLESPEVQVPRSPVILEKEPPSINIIEEAIAETPTRTPVSPNLPPVLHGIFSPNVEESLNDRVSPDDTEKDLRCTEEDSRYIEMDFDVDSDEERLANLKSRELSQQFNQDLEVSKILESKFVGWIQAAMRINSNVYAHKRLTTKLSILGNCVRTSNAGVFDATIPWCSALLLYDPFDSEDSPVLWEERNSWLISDMAKMIRWANEVHYGAEMNPLLVTDFVKLGNIARTVALHSGYNKNEYDLQKSACVAHVFMEFIKPTTDISGENSKPLSRKSLGAGSNTSKRVKI
ncbi:uncharacterized protein Bfra_007303 [Botrytis fragariae]|uniref:Uncharacterized protein n=1 Tax=Botrytis fragariae TaxID=1964551 RepID=A0A8H6AIY2_9HELO|nr:uncharacterized protein Bfra_007303 [Botrytis fragariae]KAF5868108.1 hypothetical protein Bfra_007303 [Botrytis fragariae]